MKDQQQKLQIANCKLQIENCDRTAIGRSRASTALSTRHFSFCNLHFAFCNRFSSSRSGVTLIELLVTIMIISILAAAVLGVAAVAGETAREAKTRAIISRIHALLMEQYDTYVNRRVKLRTEVLNELSRSTLPATVARRGQLKAEARLYALREMMVMEIPDRWSDVLLDDVAATPGNSIARHPVYLDTSTAANFRTELGNVYLRNFRRIAASNNKLTGNLNTRQQIIDNQGAECLYMIVMNACGDGEARTLIPESNLGDTDGDGASEFIDGWGHPIEFLRWAPGFESDIQYNANELDNPPTSTTDVEAWAAAGSADHDPFDLYRTQTTAFRLVPLIYSLGRDEEAGLLTYPDFATWRNPSNANPTISNALVWSLQLNQYLKGSPFPDEYYGTTDGTKTAIDNISNHLISSKP
jgi:prepilin-type N-terminal cleavage/methylation domain-containing protein